MEAQTSQLLKVERYRADKVGMMEGWRHRQAKSNIPYQDITWEYKKIKYVKKKKKTIQNTQLKHIPLILKLDKH